MQLVQKHKKITKTCILGFTGLSIGIFFSIYTVICINAPNPVFLGIQRTIPGFSSNVLDKDRTVVFDWPNAPALNRAMFSIPSENLDLTAQSVILIDAATGTVLYEKNADMLIPPASMTKLVTLYTAFDIATQKNISLNVPVPLPPESWIVNLPPRSSGMFLEKGQQVTALELMQGMAVASGNDAAIALADYLTGSISSFCDEMNARIRSMGLVNTIFTEPSGLSEQNMTTAREFASFCRVYITKYPESITNLHSLRSLTYPTKKNLPVSGNYSFSTITQHNTNKLLDVLDGCDGLKTGYIDESGYNIALTVRRGSMRIIAVIMGCPGKNTFEGNKNRSADGIMLTDFAYRYFDSISLQASKEVCIPVISGALQEPKYVYASESVSPVFTIPSNTSEQITRTVSYSPHLVAPVSAGQQIGTATYFAGGFPIGVIPLVSDRQVAQGNLLERILTAGRTFWVLYFRRTQAQS